MNINSSKDLKRSGLFLTNPRLFRRLVRSGIATFVLLVTLFGIDLIDSLFLSGSGVSVLRPMREFINQSIALKLFLILAWGYFVFDLAILGGVAMVTSPFNRLISLMDQIPRKLERFEAREGDEEIKLLAHSYNRMILRLLETRTAILKILDEERSESARNAKDTILDFVAGMNPPEIISGEHAGLRMKRRLIRGYFRNRNSKEGQINESN